jgi:hypothetical protein
MPKGIYKRGVCKWCQGRGFIFNSTKRKYHECPECKKEAKDELPSQDMGKRNNGRIHKV